MSEPAPPSEGRRALRKKSTSRRQLERVSFVEGIAQSRSRRDVLATEEPLEIRVGTPGAPPVPLAVTMRTPGSDFELAAGFLYGEGLIQGPEAIAAIRYCVDARQDGAQQYNLLNVHLASSTGFDPEASRRNFYTTSSCGVCGKASIEAVLAVGCAPLDAPLAVGCAPLDAPLRVDAATLLRLPQRLREGQAVFERTGGLHAAALFDAAGEMIRLREDVGRHNAMDKLVGASLLDGELPLRERVILASGRLSFELVQKAARAGVPVLAGVSAPSSLAVELAEEVGMTLVGFLREGSFNIYSGRERITDR